MEATTDFRDGILYTTFPEALTFDQVMRHIRGIGELGKKTNTLRELADFSACRDISLSLDQMKAIVRAGEGPLSTLTRYRLAMHAPFDLQYGLSRMFQALHELAEDRMEIRIFRDRAAALEWLKEAP